jgi:hypothetical protein
MTQWAVAIPAERYETERLFHHDTVSVDWPGGDAGGGPVDGDDVLVVVASEPPQLVARGRVRPGGAGSVAVAYTRRVFDAPRPATDLKLDAAVTALEPAEFQALADRLGEPVDRRPWLVSLDMPIEAESPAEAVRQFWSYVQQLGPRELPTFVSPYGDELAMQAFVLGEEANQDPEEDDEE